MNLDQLFSEEVIKYKELDDERVKKIAETVFLTQRQVRALFDDKLKELIQEKQTQIRHRHLQTLINCLHTQESESNNSENTNQA